MTFEYSRNITFSLEQTVNEISCSITTYQYKIEKRGFLLTVDTGLDLKPGCNYKVVKVRSMTTDEKNERVRETDGSGQSESDIGAQFTSYSFQVAFSRLTMGCLIKV